MGGHSFSESASTWYFDVPSLIILTSAFYVLECTSWIEPRHSPVYCDQLESINLPVPNHESVSDNELVVAVFLVPVTIIIVSECLFAYLNLLRSAVTHRAHFNTFLSIFRWLAYYIAGYGSTVIVTALIKLVSGRMRPHFLKICRPDWSIIKSVCNASSTGVIIDIDCLNDEVKAVRQARLSMPSGHASMTTFMAIFICFYMQNRWRQAFGARPTIFIIKCSIIIYAIYVCATRVADQYHRIEEVVIGAAVGGLFALLTVNELRFHLQTSMMSQVDSSDRSFSTANDKNLFVQHSSSQFSLASVDFQGLHDDVADVDA